MFEFDLEFDKLEKRWKRVMGKNCEIAGLKFQILQQGKNKFKQKNIVNLTQNLTYIFKKILYTPE